MAALQGRGGRATLLVLLLLVGGESASLERARIPCHVRRRLCMSACRGPSPAAHTPRPLATLLRRREGTLGGSVLAAREAVCVNGLGCTSGGGGGGYCCTAPQPRLLLLPVNSSTACSATWQRGRRCEEYQPARCSAADDHSMQAGRPLLCRRLCHQTAFACAEAAPQPVRPAALVTL